MAISYGDLNEGTGPGEFDSGTDMQAAAPRDVKPMGSESDTMRSVTTGSFPAAEKTGAPVRLLALIDRIQSIFFGNFLISSVRLKKCDKPLLVQQPGAYVGCIGRQSGVGFGSVEIRV